MTDKYILEGHTPVKCNDITEWGMHIGNDGEGRKAWRVAELNKDKVRISTVFLGLDHNFGVSGPPVLFETMVFGGKHHEYQARCSTWEEAEEQHKIAVKLVLGGKQ